MGIVNDVLDVSKIESGKMELSQIPFSIADIIHEKAVTFKTVIGDKPIILECLAGEDLPDPVIGDPLRLHQVLANLLSNAIKFTHGGKITLTTKLVEKSRDEVVIEFSVIDSGIGIPPDKIDRLFQYFSQMDTSIYQKYGGAGLGLLIAKELVEKMGGKLAVKSEPGKGSIFHFTAIFKLPPLI